MCVLVTQSCLTLRDPMDCSLPGSSVRGILQARVLEWLSSTGHLQNLVWRPAGVMTVAHRMVYIFTLLKLLPENLKFNQPELNVK